MLLRSSHLSPYPSTMTGAHSLQSSHICFHVLASASEDICEVLAMLALRNNLPCCQAKILLRMFLGKKQPSKGMPLFNFRYCGCNCSFPLILLVDAGGLMKHAIFKGPCSSCGFCDRYPLLHHHHLFCHRPTPGMNQWLGRKSIFIFPIFHN